MRVCPTMHRRRLVSHPDEVDLRESHRSIVGFAVLSSRSVDFPPLHWRVSLSGQD